MMAAAANQPAVKARRSEPAIKEKELAIEAEDKRIKIRHSEPSMQDENNFEVSRGSACECRWRGS